jgi:M3 family oligoendopeptidase
MTETDFQSYTLPAPTYDQVAAEHDQITRALDNAATTADAIAAVQQWDDQRRRLFTWTSLVYIRFNQDTRNEEYKRAREYCDELDPKLTNLAVEFKRRLLQNPHQGAIAAHFGAHAFDLWKCDIAAFDPAIEDDLVEQSKLAAEYTALLASAKFEFRGESLTLSEILKFNEHPQRDVRHDALRLHWGWFDENRDRLDAIFDKLVRLRQTMAEKLGQKNFIPVGYQRMQRTDYDQADVERFRKQVRDLVVPLATELRQQQASALGIDPLMAWDEFIFDPAGNPKPQGDHDWMIDRADEMFRQLGGGIDELFTQMRGRNVIDLKSREGKAGGGFCDVLPGFGLPFIFANFDGTMQDVRVFTHEMGHAFQTYLSLNKPLIDYRWPTAEACEIHSMGLEFLTWPQMKQFFGHDAVRFCRMHLTQLLLFFPYGAAVDEFQHMVYANPHASPDDRAAMWRELEQIYLPSLKWGDLAHPAGGRRWQAQRHIFLHPFYYIDYTLALTCALQLWVSAASNRTDTIERYVKLCRRGGEAPFRDLVKSVGLISPFETGCLDCVVEYARLYLVQAEAG